MKQTAEEWKRFVKQHGKLILFSMAAVLICFGFQAFNGNIRIDTEELINAPGSTLGWLYIGRFGMVLLKRLLGLAVHQTIKSGIFMLVFFWAGGALLTYGCYHFSGENKRYPYWLFLLLYATSNIWSFQFYFSMQQAEIALAMLLLVAAAIGMCRCCFEKTEGKYKTPARICQGLLSAVILVIALGSYQAMAVYYITVCTVFFLLHLLRIAEEGREEEQRLWRGVVLLALHFVISFAVYRVIADTWFMAAGDYMEGQSNWGTEPVAECIKNILRVVRNQLKTFGPRNFSFYTAGILAAFYMVWKLLRERAFRLKKHRALFVLAVVLLLASPFLMTVYSGAMLVTRTQFALPVAAAFLAMAGAAVPERYQGKKSPWVKGIKAAGILVICLQAGYNIRLHGADVLRYEHDTALAGQVAETLGEVPEEKPVLFVGYRKPELNRFARRSEMYGWSFFEWDYSPEHPAGATHRIAGFVQAYTGERFESVYTEAMERQAAELSETMGVFPAEDSVRETEDFVVVKLSEIEERTDIDWW